MLKNPQRSNPNPNCDQRILVTRFGRRRRAPKEGEADRLEWLGDRRREPLASWNRRSSPGEGKPGTDNPTGNSALPHYHRITLEYCKYINNLVSLLSAYLHGPSDLLAFGSMSISPHGAPLSNRYPTSFTSASVPSPTSEMPRGTEPVMDQACI
jgi:hypothetical protein